MGKGFLPRGRPWASGVEKKEWMEKGSPALFKGNRLIPGSSVHGKRLLEGEGESAEKGQVLPSFRPETSPYWGKTSSKVVKQTGGKWENSGSFKDSFRGQRRIVNGTTRMTAVVPFNKGALL